MEYRNDGVMEYWKDGRMQGWKLEILGSRRWEKRGKLPMAGE